MAEVRCDCCDLPVSSCGKAAEQRQRAQDTADRQALLVRGAIPARFYGSCAGCDSRFDAGTLIVRDPDGDGWRAGCCA